MDLISRDFIKRLGGECIARRDRETGELIAITGIDLLPPAVPDTVKDLVTIFQNSKDMKLIARDGDLRADRIVFGRMLFEWIPCSERLPNEGITVLVTHKGGVSTAWHNGRYWERGASTNHRKLQTVVAWMPLPEPYGEKK